MLYQNRDHNIHHATTRKNHTCYGMGLGIMVLTAIHLTNEGIDLASNFVIAGAQDE